MSILISCLFVMCSVLAVFLNAYLLNFLFLFGGFLVFSISFLGSPYRKIRYIQLSLLSYYFVSFVGLLLVLHHLHYYGQPFDAWVDDYNYFNDALGISTGEDVVAYSIYEYILALPLFAFSELIDLKPLIALWVNWIATGVAFGFIYLFTKEFTGKEPRLSLIIPLVLGNYVFVQNSAHLYRDIFVVLFFSASLYFSLKKIYSLLIVSLILLAAIRLPSALVACMFIYILFELPKDKTRSIIPKIFFSLLILGAVAYLYKTGIEYLPGKSLDIMGEYLAARTETYQEDVASDDGGGALAHNLPFPLNLPAVFVFQVLSPIRILDVFAPDNVYFFSSGEMLSHKSIGYSVTAVLWVFLGPLVFLGFFSVAFKSKLHKKFFFAFFIMCLLLGFVSFQERHKMIMISLLPIYGEYGYDFFQKNKVLGVLCSILFVSFWIVLNLN